MACFLIDYENQSGSVLGCMSLIGLTKKDEIIFFYGTRARITLDLHMELEKVPAKKSYILVKSTKENALDFLLTSCIGACINENPKRKYYIVSKDHDYDCVCDFWFERNVFVKRIDQLWYYRGG